LTMLLLWTFKKCSYMCLLWRGQFNLLCVRQRSEFLSVDGRWVAWLLWQPRRGRLFWPV